jgi:hypothetical protein
VILAEKKNSDVVVVLVTVLDLELDHLRINSQFQCVAAVFFLYTETHTEFANSRKLV